MITFGPAKVRGADGQPIGRVVKDDPPWIEMDCPACGMDSDHDADASVEVRCPCGQHTFTRSELAARQVFQWVRGELVEHPNPWRGALDDRPKV